MLEMAGKSAALQRWLADNEKKAVTGGSPACLCCTSSPVNDLPCVGACGHESDRLLRSSHPYRSPPCKDAQVKKQFGVGAGDINPDTAIVPADVLSKQALDGQAEDLAMEDTLYALEKAMQAGSLAPDVYIKQVGHPACEGLCLP